MFYLNTIEQLFLFVEQLNQLEVCLPYSRLLTVIPTLAVCQKRWNSNKTSLQVFHLNTIKQLFLYVEPLDQLEVCLPYSRLLTRIPILTVFQIP